MWWLAFVIASAPAPKVDLPALETEAFFAGGPFAPARRLVARSQHRNAVQTLRRLLRAHPDAPERPQAHYLLGLSLIHAGDYADAAQLFETLSQTYPALRDDHVYYRGLALYLWGSYLDAARVLAQVASDGPWHEPARRLRAWAMLKATDFSRLVEWLESTPERELDDELTYVLAAGKARTGDVVAAFRAYGRVWRRTDRPDLAGPALAAMSRLQVESRPLMPASVARVVSAQFALLRKPATFFKALGRLERRLLKGSSGRELRAEIAFLRGRIAESKARLRTASQSYRDAQRRAPATSDALRASIQLAYGRVLEQLDRGTESIAVYRELARRFADRPEAEQALFRAADLQLRAGKYANAKSACQRLLVTNPVTEFRQRCLWNVAWAEYRLGKPASAQQFFSTLVRGPMPPSLDAAVRYWLGRAEADLGRGEAARQRWQEVLERHPLDYYAALAERQLVEDHSGTRRDTEDQELPERLKKALEYQQLGLKKRALKEAADYEADVRRVSARPSAAAYRALARLYDESRRRRDARRVRQEAARAYATSPGAEEFLAAARRSHPLKFETQIRRAAREFDLPAPLLFALIRTESGFRADAVSAMDAYGLAQLILPTARRVATRIKAGRVTRRKLLSDTRLNVRLGAAYLRQLLDRYDGREPLALAAYNAGPNAVNAWRRRRVRKLSGVEGRGIGLAPSADEFAEEIPVQETSRFVKAVLSRARAYGVLYPDQAEPAAAAAEPVTDSRPRSDSTEVAAALVEPEHIPEPPRPRYALPDGIHLWDEDPLADPDLWSTWGWPAN